MVDPGGKGITQPSRRRYQFRLRSLLLLVTVIGIACSWIACERTKSARQRAAVEALENRGEGYASISYGVDTSPRPYALKVLLGDDIYGKMTDASLNDPSIRDKDLAHLEVLSGITDLSLGPGITDKGLIHLQHLDKLTILVLIDTQVTDEGLKVIRTLSQLDELYLDNTQISDQGLAHIAGLKLRYLSLGGTSITDAGLENLGGMAQLQALDLGGTNITDAGLVQLGKIRSLKEVNVTHTPVTEGGTAALLEALPNVILKDRFRPRGNRILSY